MCPYDERSSDGEGVASMEFSINRVLAGFLACLVFGCGSTDRPDDRRHGTIDLGSGAIDTREAEPASSDAASPDGSGQYLIVQLDGPATTADLAALAANVDQIYGYLPQDSFLVRVAPGQPVDSLGAWAGVYRPEYKIGRGVREIAESSAISADATEGVLQTIMVQAYPDADLDRIAGEVEQIPDAELVGMGTGGRFSRLRLRVPADRAVAVADTLAALPEVFWIDVEAQRSLFNDTTVWVGQSGLSDGQTTPVFDRGIHGEGQIVGFIDTGVDADSCFFRDAERGLPPQNVCDGGTAVDPDQRKVLGVDFLWSTECTGGILPTEWDTAQGHGTHVAGTILGDNLVGPIARDPGDGMAPGARLIVQDAGFANDNCADMPGIGCPVVDLKPIFEQAYAQGARLHSNSWGDAATAIPRNRYTAASEDVDEFMWTHPDFLIFFAAGNTGSNPNTVTSPSTAKNAISVGATLRAASAESMAVFSGCGPAADGRIKPDLTIPGSGIISARSDGNVTTGNCTTVAMSGTSMATPGAAGLGALVRQYYTDGFYPSGAAVASDGFVPSAALIKATMLNSARQMAASNAGTIPGNCQGWGRILLDAALFFEGQTRRLFATDDAGFAQGGAGQEKRFTFLVRENESLKASLVWTDFPSTPAASINLVNDLDLQVDGPSGTFLGNVFTGGLSQPDGAADRRNTVEQVLLAAPIPGVYTVTVRAFNVPVGPQPFALVLSGDAALNQPPIASAGEDQAGQAGSEVVLDGSASRDPDDAPAPLSFSWTQVAGPPVTLTGADRALAAFTPTELGTYEFRLQVSDGAESGEDAVTVTIANQPPVASAGADQTGFAGAAIALDGSASNDPDGAPSPLTFAWTQTGGPDVALSGADTARPTFTPAAHGTYEFLLVVSDGEDEAEDAVTVTIVNQPPVANAGPDQSGFVAAEIRLDGSASNDPDGLPSPLSFAWAQTAGPAVTLAGADTAQPSFTPTALGTYEFRLLVSDGAAQAEDAVAVTIVNRPPVASAGPDQMGFVGVEVVLDGSASSDPDDVPSPLSFSWTQTDGPTVVLTGADSTQARFTPSELGTYAFRLVVSDGAAQADDSITVTIVNQPPTALAGSDQTGLVGFPVLLDGSGSSDPDGVPSPLSFSWTQIEGPPVTLLGGGSAQPTFLPNLLGALTFRLVVSDGAAEAEDTVTVSILNQSPIANAGLDQIGLAGLPILLDGTGSLDPDGLPLPLSFLWTQIDGPPATLIGAGTPLSTFIPTALGTYTFRLAVGDGANEDDATVTVTIVNQAPVADAGADQTGLSGVPVLLSGLGSSDPDGLPLLLSYSWTQTAGPPVTLVLDTAVATFIPTTPGTYTFELVVSDGLDQDDDSVTVTIANQPPIADAGDDRTGLVGVPVLLDGIGSTDPDGILLGFAWTQTAGPPVTLVGADLVAATFIPLATGAYTFRLTVSDGAAQDDDEVTVTVGASTSVVFSDDFEQNRGWRANPSGTDTATTGRFERAVPQPTSNSGTPMQIASKGGTFDLVSGAAAGSSVGDNDIDGGTTSIVSPDIVLPAGQLTLSFAFYLAHLNNSSSADFLRVRVVGTATTTVFQVAGAATNKAAAWQTTSVNISNFAGQTVRILIDAADASGASLVEAAVDDVKIERL
jgi:hypothetical protein